MYHTSFLTPKEISQFIFNNSEEKIKITPRSIQRRLKLLGPTRTASEAWKLAATQGKVNWAYKSDKIKRRTISNKLRFEVFKRDNFLCSICGVSSKDDILETDHIIPVSQGGLDTLDNLRVLCHSCNDGKRLANNEHR